MTWRLATTGPAERQVAYKKMDWIGWTLVGVQQRAQQ